MEFWKRREARFMQHEQSPRHVGLSHARMPQRLFDTAKHVKVVPSASDSLVSSKSANLYQSTMEKPMSNDAALSSMPLRGRRYFPVAPLEIPHVVSQGSDQNHAEKDTTMGQFPRYLISNEQNMRTTTQNRSVAKDPVARSPSQTTRRSPASVASNFFEVGSGGKRPGAEIEMPLSREHGNHEPPKRRPGATLDRRMKGMLQTNDHSECMECSSKKQLSQAINLSNQSHSRRAQCHQDLKEALAAPICESMPTEDDFGQARSPLVSSRQSERQQIRGEAPSWDDSFPCGIPLWRGENGLNRRSQKMSLKLKLQNDVPKRVGSTTPGYALCFPERRSGGVLTKKKLVVGLRCRATLDNSFPPPHESPKGRTFFEGHSKLTNLEEAIPFYPGENSSSLGNESWNSDAEPSVGNSSTQGAFIVGWQDDIGKPSHSTSEGEEVNRPRFSIPAGPWTTTIDKFSERTDVTQERPLGNVHDMRILSAAQSREECLVEGLSTYDLMKDATLKGSKEVLSVRTASLDQSPSPRMYHNRHPAIHCRGVGPDLDASISKSFDVRFPNRRHCKSQTVPSASRSEEGSLRLDYSRGSLSSARSDLSSPTDPSMPTLTSSSDSSRSFGTPSLGRRLNCAKTAVWRGSEMPTGAVGCVWVGSCKGSSGSVVVGCEFQASSVGPDRALKPSHSEQSPSMIECGGMSHTNIPSKDFPPAMSIASKKVIVLGPILPFSKSTQRLEIDDGEGVSEQAYPSRLLRKSFSATSDDLSNQMSRVHNLSDCRNIGNRAATSSSMRGTPASCVTPMVRSQDQLKESCITNRSAFINDKANTIHHENSSEAGDDLVTDDASLGQTQCTNTGSESRSIIRQAFFLQNSRLRAQRSRSETNLPNLSLNAASTSDRLDQRSSLPTNATRSTALFHRSDGMDFSVGSDCAHFGQKKLSRAEEVWGSSGDGPQGSFDLVCRSPFQPRTVLISEGGHSDSVSFFGHGGRGSAFTGYTHSSGVSADGGGYGSRVSIGKYTNDSSPDIKQYVQDLTPPAGTQAFHLLRHLSNKTTTHSPILNGTNAHSTNNTKNQFTRLARRYTSSSRFLDPDAEATCSVGADILTVHSSRANSTYCSEETTQSSDSAASGSGFYSPKKHRQDVGRERKGSHGSAKPKRVVRDELSQAFHHAYQSFGIKISDSVAGSAALDFKQLTSGLNDGVHAAAESFRKLVDNRTETWKDMCSSQEATLASGMPSCRQRVPSYVASVLTDEGTFDEGIAIEVEYLSDSGDSEASSIGQLAFHCTGSSSPRCVIEDTTTVEGGSGSRLEQSGSRATTPDLSLDYSTLHGSTGSSSLVYLGQVRLESRT